MAKRQYKVIVICENDIFRAGLEAILRSSPSYSVIEGFKIIDSAIDFLMMKSVDFVVLSDDEKKNNVFEDIFKLADVEHKYKLVYLTDRIDRELVLGLESFKIDGLLDKNIEMEELIRVMKLVASGNTYMGNRKYMSRDKEESEELEKKREIYETLSKREKQVLSYLKEGMSNKEIAESLYIAERTVKVHLCHIFKKLEVKNRTQAILFMNF